MRNKFYDADYRIDILLDQYANLKLHREQAAKLADLERQWEELPKTDFLQHENSIVISSWEELDYQYWMFQQVLDSAQLEAYDALHRQRMLDMKNDIAQRDAASLSDLEHHRNLVDHCRRHVLPQIRALELSTELELCDVLHHVDFLRTAYSRIVEKRRLQDIAGHLREYRNLAPNGLQIIMLQNDLQQLLPEFPVELFSLDAAAKAVQQAIIPRLAMLLTEHRPAIEDIVRDYSKFKGTSLRTHLGEPERGGWHVTLVNNQNSDDLWQDQLLGVLLAMNI